MFLQFEFQLHQHETDVKKVNVQTVKTLHWFYFSTDEQRPLQFNSHTLQRFSSETGETETRE